MTKTKYLWIKGHCGLGNRMLSLLTALKYAELVRRKVVVDWREGMYADKGTNAFSLFFNKTEWICDPSDVPDGQSVCPAVWNDCLDMEISAFRHRQYQQLKQRQAGKSALIRKLSKLSRRMPLSQRQYSIRLDGIDRSESVAVFYALTHKSKCIKRILHRLNRPEASWTDVELLKDTAEKYLQPSESILSSVDAFRRQFFKGTVLGIHVRHSDRRSPMKKVIRNAEKLFKIHQPETIYLATDNAEVIDLFRSRFPSVVVYGKRFSSGGGGIHYDKTMDKVQMTRDALIELYLLAQCDLLLYASRSTFSFLARVLSGLPERNVVDIDKYNCASIVKSKLQSVG